MKLSALGRAAAHQAAPTARSRFLPMNPRINVGRGVTGAVNYVFGPGRDPKTGHIKPEPEDGQSRVKWIGGPVFGFETKTRGAPALARRIMEFDSLNGTTQCRMDCVHISLSWRPGE